MELCIPTFWGMFLMLGGQASTQFVLALKANF